MQPVGICYFTAQRSHHFMIQCINVGKHENWNKKKNYSSADANYKITILHISIWINDMLVMKLVNSAVLNSHTNVKHTSITYIFCSETDLQKRTAMLLQYRTAGFTTLKI